MPLFKKRKIQMYAGEEPFEIDVVDDIDAPRKLIEGIGAEITQLREELAIERNKIQNLANDKTQLTTDLTNKNNEINTILTKWKAKDLNELSEGIQAIVDELDASDEELKNRAKNIRNLKLKNEKLTQNQKKLYGYLGDAWKMVSHLQKDLQTEKQDKAHIQKELDDTLTILNKPTAEMGTQTDLTAEQITWMEQKITKYQTDIQQKHEKISLLQTELTTLQSEIKGLQEKVKDKEPNETEQALSEVIKKPIAWEIYATHNTNPKNLLRFLETGNSIFGGLSPSRVYDWNQLRGEYKDIHTKLIQLTKNMIESNERQHEITKLEKDKNELQTKYDMEVRSKEELVKELQKEKGWWDKWMVDNKKMKWEKGSAFFEIESIDNVNPTLSKIKYQPSYALDTFYFSKSIKDLIYEYYK